MAFIGQSWVLDVTFVDSGANQTTRRYELAVTDDAGDLTDVIAAVASVMTVLVADSDAHISKQTLSKTSVEDSFTLPTGAVNVEENAQISAKIAGIPNKSAVFEVPAPKIGMFQATSGPGRNLVQFATAPTPAIVNIFKAGGEATISDGETITDQGIKGRRIHHKSTKG